MYKIERGIPIPTQLPEIKFVILNMCVGDSFECLSKDITRISATCSYYSQKFKMKFTRRKASSCSHRIWRIS